MLGSSPVSGTVTTFSGIPIKQLRGGGGNPHAQDGVQAAYPDAARLDLNSRGLGMAEGLVLAALLEPSTAFHGLPCASHGLP